MERNILNTPPQVLSKMSKMELGLYFTHYAQVLSKMSKMELGLYFTHYAQVLSKMSKTISTSVEKKPIELRFFDSRLV